MIQQIRNDNILKRYLRDTCEENGIKITIDERIDNDEISIISIDSYYNEQMPYAAPPSADFLVSLFCFQNAYRLYVIELRDINSPQGFDPANIYNKFETTIYDFMNERFKDIYMNGTYRILDLKIYFVSDPYELAGTGITHTGFKLRRNIDSTRIDALLTKKPFKFRGRIYQIQYEIPPNPIIKKLAI